VSTHSDARDDKERQRRLGFIPFNSRGGADPTDDDVRDAVDGRQPRGSSALAVYRLARESRQLGGKRGKRMRAFRCATGGCLLLDVFDTPEGLAVFHPAVRLSPDQNDDTDLEARAERTSDGERRWVEHADLLRDGVEYALTCEHALNWPIEGWAVRRESTPRNEDPFVVR